MNKFQRNLKQSNREIKGKRADIVAEDAKIAIEDLVRREKNILRNLDKEEVSLTDIYPDSEFSLMAAQANFDAPRWIDRLFEIKLEKAVQKVKLDAALAIAEEWFTEEKK